MLRFMGDLPEPVVEEDIPKEAAPTGLRKKVSTLGRKFLMSNNKLIAQTGGLEGEEGYQPEDDEQAMVLLLLLLLLFLLLLFFSLEVRRSERRA